MMKTKHWWAVAASVSLMLAVYRATALWSLTLITTLACLDEIINEKRR